MKKILFTLIVSIFMAGAAYSASFTETQVGGDTTGSIAVTVQKFYNSAINPDTQVVYGWQRAIKVFFETRDSGGVVIRSRSVDIDYDGLTAGQKAYVDGIITKAIAAAKAQAAIQ